jgi:hypothetical protein
MSKKDFIALADYLRGQEVPESVLAALVAFCRSRNPRFDEARWRGYLAGTNGPSGGARKREVRYTLAD